jgi:threonine/homoserine/homoserine lactone efflux protein
METTTILLYVLAVATVTAIPGPTMLLALNNGATGGMRLAAWGIAGAALSDLVLIGDVGCGLGAILQASERMFVLVKWGGTLYLLYLAATMWRTPTAPLRLETSETRAGGNGRTAFMRSLLVALSNPKGLLFFSAFLPQFVQPTAPVAVQYATLAFITALVDIVLMALYAMGGQQAVRLLSAHAMAWLNRGCAGMLAALALALGLYQRSER